MRFHPLFLAPLLACTLSCEAQGIYKCTEGNNVTYQSQACESGRGQLMRLTADATAINQPTAREVVVRPEERFDMTIGLPRGIATNRAELRTGMSDIEVLNNRQWGRPLRITRSREARAWHEFWEYEKPDTGARRLHFVNGALAGVDEIQERLITPVAALSVAPQ